MQILVKGTSVHHVCCTTATEIFCTGDGARHGYLRNTVLNRFDKLLCAVNEGGDHWVLVFVELEQKKLIYINLLGELLTSRQKILQY